MTMAGRGRKTKYTPETVERILQAIRVGSVDEHAAEYGGIDGATFYRWMQRYSEFCEAVTRAKAEARTQSLARIRKAGADGDWRADAWFLERRYPQDYGKRAVEVSGPDGGAIVIKGYTSITPDDWQAPAERQDDSDV